MECWHNTEAAVERSDALWVIETSQFSKNIP